MSPEFEYLDTDDLVDLATGLLGDPPPIRDLGLLGSAAGRPQASAFGEDAYPDLWTKAAALLHSIVKNPALVDGNKRLGWLATAVFLEINSIPVTDVPNDEVYDFVMAVTTGREEVAEIAVELRSLVECRPAVSPELDPCAQSSDRSGERARHSDRGLSRRR